MDSALSDTANPGACIRIQRLEFPGASAPLRMELHQFRNPASAFIAWERLATQERRPQEGSLRVGPRWAFIHDSFLGLTDSSAGELYPEEFRERLAAAPEPAILPPGQFKAFPLLGRIPGSERVFAQDFLGGPWSGPAFSVSYPCHGDTAIAFRAKARDASALAEWMRPWKPTGVDAGHGDKEHGGFFIFEKEKRFSGTDEFGSPIVLRVFSDGVLGVSGCYDSELGQEYAEKMRKMQVFWHDP